MAGGIKGWMSKQWRGLVVPTSIWSSPLLAAASCYTLVILRNSIPFHHSIFHQSLFFINLNYSCIPIFHWSVFDTIASDTLSALINIFMSCINEIDTSFWFKVNDEPHKFIFNSNIFTLLMKKTTFESKCNQISPLPPAELKKHPNLCPFDTQKLCF